MFKYRIDLKNPKTLDEKIHYLKFNEYYNNPLITQCADKYRVREYVKACSCEEILNELYFVWDDVEQIEWNKLPQQFVIKWNFGCGQNLICFDKDKLDIATAKKQLKKWRGLYDIFWRKSAEIHYRNIEPKLVCERLITTPSGELPVDYKLYCFGGEPDCALICVGRDSDGHQAKYYFFDKKGNLLRYNKAGKAAPADFSIEMPVGYEKLFDYAQKLTQPFPFVRCDFYLEEGKVIFGELTFTPCGGFDPNRLPETQLYFGSKVTIKG